jgi:hypothetical protein
MLADRAPACIVQRLGRARSQSIHHELDRQAIPEPLSDALDGG